MVMVVVWWFCCVLVPKLRCDSEMYDHRTPKSVLLVNRLKKDDVTTFQRAFSKFFTIYAWAFHSLHSHTRWILIFVAITNANGSQELQKTRKRFVAPQPRSEVSVTTWKPSITFTPNREKIRPVAVQQTNNSKTSRDPAGCRALSYRL